MVVISRDDLGNRTVYKSDGFKLVEEKLNTPKKTSSNNIEGVTSYKGVIVDSKGTPTTIVFSNKDKRL